MFHVEQPENIVPMTCLVCDNQDISFLMKVKDHFLSGETFSLYKCNSCGLISTFPAPDENSIADYYKSEKYISHSSKPASLFEFLYRQVRNVTLKSKAKITSEYAQGKKILDIGCATGEYLIICKKKGFEVFGVEPNQKVREIALAKNGLKIDDLNTLDLYNPESFDVITMWHVLEHVHDINERMARINQLLKPNGTAIIAVPNPESYDANYYIDRWAAYDVPRHLFHFTQKTIKTLAEKYGFIVREILPMKYDAFYVSLLSEKYKKGRTSFLQAIKIGIKSNLKARRQQNNYSSLIYILNKK